MATKMYPQGARKIAEAQAHDPLIVARCNDWRNVTSTTYRLTIEDAAGYYRDGVHTLVNDAGTYSTWIPTAGEWTLIEDEKGNLYEYVFENMEAALDFWATMD